MTTPILENEFTFDSAYDAQTRECVCWVYYLDSLIVEHRSDRSYFLHQEAYHEACRIIKEWDAWLDQTSNTELKYRKTIISSCGQLTVTESPA